MKFTKQEKSWIMYDWANSAYTLAVTTSILPIVFKASAQEAGISASQSTAYWGYINAFASLFIAILAPILGTIADYKDRKKKFFAFFFLLGVGFTLLLPTVPMGKWQVLLFFYMFTGIGFAGANIFYDAFLVDVSRDDRMDDVSSTAFGYGYIGSTIPFVIGIGIIQLHDKIGISTLTASNIAFIITALWWGLFTIPFLKNVKQNYYIEPDHNPIKKSMTRLLKTLKSTTKYRHIFLFLIAYFFYIDGVGTIIKMATVYGTDVGIGATGLLLILLVIQIVAFPFALLFGRLCKRYSNKTMITIGIMIYIVACLKAFTIQNTFDFWIVALLIATAQGGIQALSRSYYAKIIPKENSNEFFGLYNIFGKFAAIMGPFLVGIVTQVTGNSRYGVLSIIALFLVGLVFLLRLPKAENISRPEKIKI